MQNFGNPAARLRLKHGQIPFGSSFIESEDVDVSVIGFNLEIPVIEPMPLIQVLDDLYGASAEIESSDHFRASMAGICLDLEIHHHEWSIPQITGLAAIPTPVASRLFALLALCLPCFEPAAFRRKIAYDFLESCPFHCGPHFCLGMAERSDKS